MSTGIFRKLLPLLLAALWVSQLWAGSFLNKRVVVYLKVGGKVSGVVVDEKADGTITLQISGGQATLKRELYDRIVVQRPVSEEFAERSAACKTAEDWVKLAKWCGLGLVRLPQERRRCLEEALGIDADHEGAHRELGHVKVRDKWYPEQEGKKLLGLVKVGDKWYPPDEAERIKRRKKLAKNKKHMRGKWEQEEEYRGIPWATAKVLDRPHYRVKCNSTPDVANRYADVMEALYRAYDEVFPEAEFPRYTNDKGVIYIFRNNDEFMDFTLMGRGIGGFFMHTDVAVRAYHGSFGLTGSTEMVLAHEATHQFQWWIMKNMRTVSTWLIEGMAVYYGDGTKISRNRVELHQIPRDRLQTLKEAINGGHYTNLRTLLRISRGAFGGQYYNHAWGIIYWCLQGDRPEYKNFPGAHTGEGKKIWDQYLRHVCRDSKPITAVMQRFAAYTEEEAERFQNLILKETGHESIDAWEVDYKQFILKLPLEPLGVWDGLTWDGSRQVGLKMRFPKGLKPVPEEHLRQPFREAAAVQSRQADVRMWVAVDYNWGSRAIEDDDALLETLDRTIRGFFRMKEPGTFVEEPKTMTVNGIGLVMATFEGRLARRRERSTFVVNKRPGATKGKKKAKAVGKKAQKKPASGFKQLDPDAPLKIKIALLTTDDKFYTVVLAGHDAPFSKIAPNFERSLNSIQLFFGKKE